MGDLHMRLYAAKQGCTEKTPVYPTRVASDNTKGSGVFDGSDPLPATLMQRRFEGHLPGCLYRFVSLWFSKSVSKAVGSSVSRRESGRGRAETMDAIASWNNPIESSEQIPSRPRMSRRNTNKNFGISVHS